MHLVEIEHVEPKGDVSKASSPVADAAPTRVPQQHSTQPGVQIGNVVAQAKLSVGPAGDKYEHEADAVAASVVRSIRSDPSNTDSGVTPQTTSRVQRGSSASTDRDIGSDDAGSGHDGESVGGRIGRIRRSDAQPEQAAHLPVAHRVQRSAPIGSEGGELDSDTSRILQSSRTGGKPLAGPAKSTMEQAFGADFSNVRVHSGPTSTELNNRIQAKAFTTGNDIYFRDGVPDTSNSSDQELLAHELTHTIQQGPTKINRSSAHPIATSTAAHKDSIQRDLEDEGIEMTTYSSNVVEEDGDELDEVTPTVTRALKVLREDKDGSTKIAAEAYIQAKQQAKASKSGAQGEATALAVAKASASAEVTKTLTSIEVLVKAGVLAEASLEATGSYKKSIGPATVEILGKVKAYAKASLDVSAKATIDTSGITLEASAEAVAEVGVSISSALSLATSSGKQLAKLSADGQATAGGRAKASGTAKITSEGIVLSGEFEAFAGVEAKGKINFVIGPNDAPYLTAVLKGGASAGIGAKGSGTFKIENGQIILSAELAATLGIGGSGGFDIAIGYQAIATAIYEGVAASFAPTQPAKSQDIEMTTFADHSGAEG